MRLELRLETARVAPGEELAGDVLVVEGGDVRTLTLTVAFCERSPGYLLVASGSAWVLHEGALTTGESVPFRYALLPSALPTARGRHGELFWQVEVVADVPGLDARADAVFEVATA